MKVFILIVGKELDAEGDAMLVGPFASQDDAFLHIRSWIDDHKDELDMERCDDLLDDTQPFYRVTDNYGNMFELHVREPGKRLDDILSYGE